MVHSFPKHVISTNLLNKTVELPIENNGHQVLIDHFYRLASYEWIEKDDLLTFSIFFIVLPISCARGSFCFVDICFFKSFSIVLRYDQRQRIPGQKGNVNSINRDGPLLYFYKKKIEKLTTEFCQVSKCKSCSV